MTSLLWQFALILELLGDPKGKATVMGGGIHSRVAQNVGAEGKLTQCAD